MIFIQGEEIMISEQSLQNDLTRLSIVSSPLEQELHDLLDITDRLVELFKKVNSAVQNPDTTIAEKNARIIQLNKEFSL